MIARICIGLLGVDLILFGSILKYKSLYNEIFAIMITSAWIRRRKICGNNGKPQAALITPGVLCNKIG